MPSSGRLARALTFALPILSVLVAALVFLGPGSLRPAVAARVRGVVSEGSRRAALRVELVRTYHDVVDVAPAREIAVTGAAPGASLPTVTALPGPDGIADVQLAAPTPLAGKLALRVTAGSTLLAGGEVPLRRAPAAFVQLGAIRGTSRGDLAVRVDATRGVLASPFPETLRLTVTRPAADAPLGERAELELSGAGLEITPARLSTDERGGATVVVKALAHHVELAVSARAGARSGAWEGTLPVVPGAIWLDPASPPAAPALVAPVPRSRAYVSLWTEEGRVLGAAVPLARDEAGFFRGRLAAELPAGRIVYATVAGDPLEQGSSTVAWPLWPAEGAVAGAGRLELLLDGVPAAMAREQQRAWAARRVGLVLIGAAALAELLLLLVQSRASQRRLVEHVTASAAALPAEDRERLVGAVRERPLLGALLLVALVGLGFALIAALSTFR